MSNWHQPLEPARKTAPELEAQDIIQRDQNHEQEKEEKSDLMDIAFENC